MKRMMVMFLIAVSAPVVVRAGKDLDAEMKKDVVLRALVDEIERGRVGLKLEDLERPYFIEYALIDATSANASARLGAVTGKNESRSRRVRTDVRVGSYVLDNTNFSDGYGGLFFGGMFGGRFGSAPVPIEDDYNAIRQALWWSTDREYKTVVEALAKKKAFMESKVIEDKPNDFSREQPVVDFEERTEPAIELARLEALAVTLSRIFREYPQIKDSSVSIRAAGGNKYLVNTEGTRLRVGRERAALTVDASVQADDGMEFSDSLDVYAWGVDKLPSTDELTTRCRRMAERLIAVKNAPTLESYTGPVLFEPEAAAAIFAAKFADNFAGGQRPLGSRRPPNDFANKIGKRILPRFMDVVDDPTRDTIAETPVLGHYRYDDQGVPARPVSLVEDGQLRSLVMSRNPSKDADKSTGHGRGIFQPDTSIGCLVVRAEPGDDAAKLREELLSACEDEDLEFGIRVASLGDMDSGFGSRFGFSFSFGFGQIGGRGGITPLAMYKVYPDGREELVRGVEIGQIDLRAFKRILAAGRTPSVLNKEGQASRTVVAPALLFEELDLAKIDRDFDKPPFIKTPLARGNPK